MKCPFCGTENREDRDTCYYCSKDISMLRLLVNKARHHFNHGLEHAERGRLKDAAAELVNALDLDSNFSQARVVLGTIYAKMEDMEKARETWREAICRDRNLEKAFEYLNKVDQVIEQRPMRKWLRISIASVIGLFFGLISLLAYTMWTPAALEALELASRDVIQTRYQEADSRLAGIIADKSSDPRLTQAARAMNRLIKGYLEGYVDRAREEIPRGEFARARQEIDTITSISASRPAEIDEKIDNLRKQARTQVDVELERLRSEVDQARTREDAEATRARLDRLMRFSDDATQRARVLDTLAHLEQASAKLPAAPTLDGMRERQRYLADFTMALEAGDWSGAQAALVYLLGDLQAEFLAPIGRLAEIAWAERLARTGFPDSAATDAARVRERFPSVRFDPIARARATVAAAASAAGGVAATAGGDDLSAEARWFATWFERNEARLAGRTADPVLLTLARENLVDLRGPMRAYFAGLVAWAAGDAAGARAQLSALTDEASGVADGALAAKLAAILGAS